MKNVEIYIHGSGAFYFYQMLAQYILLILHHMLYKLYHLYHGQYCILYTF